jgi:hypothetical protein
MNAHMPETRTSTLKEQREVSAMKGACGYRQFEPRPYDARAKQLKTVVKVSPLQQWSKFLLCNSGQSFSSATVVKASPLYVFLPLLQVFPTT